MLHMGIWAHMFKHRKMFNAHHIYQFKQNLEAKASYDLLYQEKEFLYDGCDRVSYL